MSVSKMLDDGHDRESVAVNVYRQLQSELSNVFYNWDYHPRRYDCRFGKLTVIKGNKSIDIYIDEDDTFTICYGCTDLKAAANEVLAVVKAIFIFT